jgi:hypothetical protein
MINQLFKVKGNDDADADVVSPQMYPGMPRPQSQGYASGRPGTGGGEREEADEEYGPG